MVLLSSLSFPTPHCANSTWFGRKEGSHRNTRFDFVFLSWGTPPVVRSHTDSTDVDLQHRDGLMAGAQAHKKQRTTENIKGTLSKQMEVCFLQRGSPPSEHHGGRSSPFPPSPWQLMQYQ